MDGRGGGAAGKPERDFLSFRERGDAEALARVFDALAPELLLVAHHLAPEAASAEDLVQTVFLAAIQDARDWDPRRPLRPWLVGILAHRATDLRRRARVRGQRELGGDEEERAQLDPAEVAASRELAERVAVAIERLPERYRRVLALRLVHGLEPTAIAHALGLRPGTVRMRLQRGLERLRDALPAGLALPAFLFAELGGGLRGAREAVLERAASATPSFAPSGIESAGAASRGAAQALTGTMAMNAKTMLGAAAAVAAAGVLWLLARDDEVAPPRSVRAGEEELLVADASPEAPPARPGTPERSAPDDERAPEAASVERPTELVVRVRFAGDGSPAGGVGVYARPGGGGLGVEARADAEGEARFEALAPGEHLVDLDRWVEEPARVQVRSGTEARAELALPAGVRVDGRVVDLDGAPVAHARVFRVNSRHHDLLHALCEADSEGRFALRDLAPDVQLVARAAGHQPSEPETVRGAPGGASSLELELGADGLRLEGVVLGGDGAPVPNALVAIAVHEDAREERTGYAGGREERESRKSPDLEAFFVRADAQGRFASDEVPAGRARVFARPLQGGAEVAWAVVDVFPGRAETTSVALHLHRGAEIAGRVANPAGEPLAGYVVTAEWEGTQELGQTEDELGPWFADRLVRTDAEGELLFEGLLPGDYDLRVLAPDAGADALGFRGDELARAELTLAPGERARYDATVEDRVELVVRVLDPEGAPLAGWAVGADARYDAIGAVALMEQRTGADGRARIPGLARRPQEIGVYAPGTELGLAVLPSSLFEGTEDGIARIPVATRAGVRPDGGELELRLRPDEMPSARARGRLVDARGAALDATGLFVEREDRREQDPVVAGADGAFETHGLAPGSYRVVSRLRGFPRGATLASFALGAGEVRELGTLVLEDPAHLTVELIADDGGAIDEGEVSARYEGRAGDDELWFGNDREDRKTFRSGPLAAGTLLLVARGADAAPARATVELRAGEQKRMTLACGRGRAVRFAIDAPPDPTGRADTRVQVELADLDGLLLVDDRIDARYGPRGELSIELRLEAGEYRARFEHHPFGVSYSGAFAEVSFRVPAEGAIDPIPVAIR